MTEKGRKTTNGDNEIPKKRRKNYLKEEGLVESEKRLDMSDTSLSLIHCVLF